MDSGCSRYMSGKSNLFSDINEHANGTITLGDKGKCVYLVNGLKFNLLCVSQLSDNGKKVIFDKEKCIVKSTKSREVL